MGQSLRVLYWGGENVQVSRECLGMSRHTCLFLAPSRTGSSSNPARLWRDHMKRISAQFVVLSVLFLGCCAGVFAQATSQISGTVTDASGAVVAGAQITATQTDTGVTRSVTSDANGVYSLPSLPLGPYRLEVKKEGFTTHVAVGHRFASRHGSDSQPCVEGRRRQQTCRWNLRRRWSIRRRRVSAR